MVFPRVEVLTNNTNDELNVLFQMPMEDLTVSGKGLDFRVLGMCNYEFCTSSGMLSRIFQKLLKELSS